MSHCLNIEPLPGASFGRLLRLKAGATLARLLEELATVHTATWFDAAQHDRIMWRATVFGNPGTHYAGESAIGNLDY